MAPWLAEEGEWGRGAGACASIVVLILVSLVFVCVRWGRQKESAGQGRGARLLLGGC